MTSANLQNYYKDEVNDAVNKIVADGMLNNDKTTTSKSLGYKTSLKSIEHTS